MSTEEESQAVTPQRASRFVTQHLPNVGDKLSSHTLMLQSKEEFMSLLAVMTFSQSSDQAIRWRVRPQGDRPPPENTPLDYIGHYQKDGIVRRCKLKRFTIERMH